MSRTSPFLFDQPLSQCDPHVAELILVEGERQKGKLILIASESICPRPVNDALASPFSAIYAEGYPSSRLMGPERDIVTDHDRHLAFYRRYADRRYYKGCEYTNLLEVTAQKRAAEVFAANGLRADDLFVNVQPLSGAAANNAVYQAFVQPGDTVMGMALPHGGHLTHGSEFNRSGKLYHIVPYLLDPKTHRLDYDAIKDAAKTHQPRMLIAGASAYPWEIDWKALREAADQVRGGCTLLADISHPAGLVAAGEFPSPIGYADVVSMTTHKTLCGPRGAIIVTTDRTRADAIDLAVFPGEQGGPHIHQIAGKAVAFGLAQTETFRELMRKIRGNASTLAARLQERGLRVQGGGTASHLFLVDLKEAKGKTTPAPLYGDVAANLLDLCNITCNKNTIAGDASAHMPTGLRLGTTILSQQGYTEEHMRTLGDLIAKVLVGAQTFTVITGGGERGRARLDRDLMEEVKAGVAELTGSTPPDCLPAYGKAARAPREREHIVATSPEAVAMALSGRMTADEALEGSPPRPLASKGISSALILTGERAGVFLQGVVSIDVFALEEGADRRALMLDAQGKVFAEIEIHRAANEGPFQQWHLFTHPSALEAVEGWLRGLSDGYLHFDEDLTRKIDGPVAIKRVQGLAGARDVELRELREPSARIEATARHKEEPSLVALEKPWFLGRLALDRDRAVVPAGPPYEWVPPETNTLRKTPLHALHGTLTKPHNMVPFAGWDMPVLYTSILEEHRLVRRAGGLFDLAHMGTMEISGPGATRFLDLVTTNFVWKLRPGQSQYTYVLKPSGQVMDDLLVYMLAPERYLVVANACNADEVLSWFRRAAAGEACVSNERRDVRLDAKPRVRDLKDPSEGGDACLVDLGLQGQQSRNTLLRLAAGHADARRAVSSLRKGEQLELHLGGFDVVVSRTGYTGEDIGYEVFVHPDRARDLWTKLTELGDDLGIGPAGLGARDSLRTEAGFPLFGHELAGPDDVLPLEAGYAAFVKEHKPFFVGREPHVAKARASKRRVVRMRFEHTGLRMFQTGDPVVNARGQVIGRITSAILPGEHQLALALVDVASVREGTRLGVFNTPRKQGATTVKSVGDLMPGDQVPIPEPAVVLERFPKSCADAESCGAG